ncbi:hypothetical protein E4U38_001422 [Claviceps purpurea]|nr:hypothetical protein E4U38_001422 [Claviceps purpurea]
MAGWTHDDVSAAVSWGLSMHLPQVLPEAPHLWVRAFAAWQLHHAHPILHLVHPALLHPASHPSLEGWTLWRSPGRPAASRSASTRAMAVCVDDYRYYRYHRDYHGGAVACEAVRWPEPERQRKRRACVSRVSARLRHKSPPGRVRQPGQPAAML